MSHDKVDESKKSDMFGKEKDDLEEKKKKNPDIKKVKQALTEKGYTKVQTKVFRDSYIDRVVSVPERTLEKTVDKFVDMLTWRKEFDLPDLIPSKYSKQLTNGSTYVHGYSKDKFPILWLIGKQKDWKHLEIENEIRATVLVLEDVINKFLPNGIDSFYIVINAEGLGPRDFDINLMKGLINLLVKAYPDRTQGIFVGPTNVVVRGLYKLVSPFLPDRLKEKVRLMKKPEEELGEILGEDNVPTFFGGKYEQPSFLNKESVFDYELVRAEQQKLFEKVSPPKKTKKKGKKKKKKSKAGKNHTTAD